MIRRLEIGDFHGLWECGNPFIDSRLKPDIDRARSTYGALLSQAGVYAEGEFDGEKIIGAAIATTHENAFAKKSYANVDLWIGRVCLLDRLIEWWEGRPVLRALVLQFPSDVRPGLYRILRSRGFDRSGDMNVLWR